MFTKIHKGDASVDTISKNQFEMLISHIIMQKKKKSKNKDEIIQFDKKAVWNSLSGESNVEIVKDIRVVSFVQLEKWLFDRIGSQKIRGQGCGISNYLVTVVMFATLIGMTEAGVPQPPEKVDVRVATANSLQVTITPPVDNGGANITHYPLTGTRYNQLAALKICAAFRQCISTQSICTMYTTRCFTSHMQSLKYATVVS